MRRLAAITLAMLAGVAATVRLGVWQLDRAGEKTALQTTLDERAHLPPLDEHALARSEQEAQAQEYRPVALHGRWIAGHTIYLDNRSLEGHAGFIVVTPLRLDARDDAILVQRGWTPRDARDPRLVPRVPEPAGEVVVRGRIAPPPGRLFEFGAPAPGAIRQNLDLAALSAQMRLPLVPATVQQADPDGTAGDGLVRRWPAPALDVEKNYGYAFQWFAMSALMAGLYVWFQILRPRLRRPAA